MVDSARRCFAMGSSCTLTTAEDLRIKLIEHLRQAPDEHLAVDLSEIAVADVSLLQILVSLRKTILAKGLDLEVHSNECVDDLLARAGLTGWNDGPAEARALSPLVSKA